ncbi:MAG: DUF3568 family protein [Verrucomicrobia bacterium]|jgi:hypothetical protein|nr:DUF3568 family protein [Verrucomicrobiota bacterium]
MKIRILFPALLATTAALVLPGCSTVNLDATGDTQAVYELGQFQMVVNTTAPVTFNATQKAFKDLDLYQTKATLNTYDAHLEARARNDQKVTVDIAEVNSRQTLLKIRWGTTGSKANSRALYDAIEHNLR